MNLAKKARKGRATKGLMRALKKHPVRSASIAAGAVLGIALLRKAANTAAKVVTITAVAKGASEIAGAVRSKGGRKGSRARGARRSTKARIASKA